MLANEYDGLPALFTPPFRHVARLDSLLMARTRALYTTRSIPLLSTSPRSVAPARARVQRCATQFYLLPCSSTDICAVVYRV